MPPGHRTCFPRAARRGSPAGLTANDFLRGGSVIALNEKGLSALADDIRLLADKEGLTAHQASIDIRTMMIAKPRIASDAAKTH